MVLRTASLRSSAGCFAVAETPIATGTYADHPPAMLPLCEPMQWCSRYVNAKVFPANAFRHWPFAPLAGRGLKLVTVSTVSTPEVLSPRSRGAD